MCFNLLNYIWFLERSNIIIIGLSLKFQKKFSIYYSLRKKYSIDFDSFFGIKCELK
jgi:hypothetical protein